MLRNYNDVVESGKSNISKSSGKEIKEVLVLAVSCEPALSSLVSPGLQLWGLAVGCSRGQLRRVTSGRHNYKYNANGKGTQHWK